MSKGAGRYRKNEHRTSLANNTILPVPKRAGTVPPTGPDVVRVIPLGGTEQIGQNMTAVEYQDDIVIIDAGFQFRTETTPGIDYIIPNVSYLEERKDKIKAMFITHAHLDHIGGIPYVMEKLGNPPIYSRLLSTVMIKRRQEEFPHMKPLDLRTVEQSDSITCGDLKVEFFGVTHTIPEAMGIIVHTPHGAIVNTGDMKLDHVDGVPTEHEQTNYGVFKDMNVLAFIADSTNVERPGWSIPESNVHVNLDEIIKNTKGRLIVGMFASQIDRITAVVKSAEKYNKKIVIEGRSMKQNIAIIRELNILVPKNGTIISPEEIDNYPPDKIIAIVTGAQGDQYAALMRMSVKKHKYFALNPRDTILLSASVIPGNETAVQRLKDNIARQGVRIIHYRNSDVHATGHAYKEEARWAHNIIKPKFFIPVHGNHYMLRVHADLAEEAGTPRENIIIPDNGSIIDFEKGEKVTVRKENACASGPVIVDGFIMGGLPEVVLRDREHLATDGMFVIIVSINPHTGKLRKSPDIISRGFVYMRESQQLVRDARHLIKQTVESSAANMNPVDFDKIKDVLSDQVGRFLFQETAKHPLVIPVIIGV